MRLRERSIKTASMIMAISCLFVLSGTTFVRNAVWESEIGLLEDAIGKSPGKFRVHNNLGRYYHFTDHRYDKAIEHYQAALSLAPHETKIIVNIGLAYKAKGDIETAIYYFLAALREEPDNPVHHVNLGAAFIAKGLMNDGFNEYQIALSLQPDCTEARFHLGMYYLHPLTKDIVKAQAEMEAILRMDPAYEKARKFLKYIEAKRSSMPGPGR